MASFIDNHDKIRGTLSCVDRMLFPPRGKCAYAFDDVHRGLPLSALSDAGIRVPNQVALVGSDDRPLCEMLPRLSSVAQDAAEMQETFAEPILEAIRGRWTQGTRKMTWQASSPSRQLQEHFEPRPR
jgi:hypothetical protein